MKKPLIGLFLFVLILLGLIGLSYSKDEGGSGSSAASSSSGRAASADKDPKDIIISGSSGYSPPKGATFYVEKSGDSYILYEIKGEIDSKAGSPIKKGMAKEALKEYVFDDYKEAVLASRIGSITHTGLDKKKESFVGDPTSFTPEEISTFRNFDITPNIFGYSDLYGEIGRLEDLEKAGDLSTEDKAKLSEYSKLFSTIKKDSDMLLHLVSHLPANKRTEVLNKLNRRDCDGFLSTITCAFTAENTEKKLISDIFDRELRGLKGEEHNTKLKEVTQKTLQKYYGDYDLPASCTGEAVDYLACKRDVSTFKVCSEKENCDANTQALLHTVDLAYKKELVDKGGLYEVADLILRQDGAALTVTSFFGIEPNPSQVPSFIRDSFPSQICAAKIEGYLDKHIESNGGISYFSCGTDSKPHYDYVKGRVVNGDSENCVNILADIRAQRTVVTPDLTSSMTYSYFIKAPPTAVNYLLAVSYREDGIIKKVPIIETQKLSNNSKDHGFDSVILQFNSSNVDEGSFEISLVAAYDDGSPYLVLSYPVVLITAGDSYYRANDNGVVGNDLGHSTAQVAQNQIGNSDLLGLI